MTTLHRDHDQFRIPGTEGIDLIGSWLYDPDDLTRVVGLHLHHPYDEIAAGRWAQCGGGGYIAWDECHGTRNTGHQMVRGGPDRLDELTITPSLWHRAKGHSGENSPMHGCHGYVTDGRWVVI